MILAQKRLLLACFFIFANYPIYANLSPLQTSGLYDGINKYAKTPKKGFLYRDFISPLLGMDLWETGVVEHMYRFGDKKDALIELTRMLFFLHPDDVTFGPTVHPRNIASYFNSKAIAASLKFYMKSLDEPERTKEFAETLELELRDLLNLPEIIQNAQEMQNNFVTNMVNVLHAYNKDRSPQLQLSFSLDISNYKALEKDQALARKKLKEIQLQLLDTSLQPATTKNLKDKEAVYSKYIQFVADIKRYDFALADLKREIAHYVIVLWRSFRETLNENASYTPQTACGILLSFLWKKYEKKVSFINFLKEFPLSWHLLTQRSYHFLRSNYDQNCLNKSYEKKIKDVEKDVIKRFTTQNYVSKDSPFLDDYETTTASLYNKQLNNNTFPPTIQSIQATYKDPRGIKHTFPNCVEASLQNLFNLICYDTKTKLVNARSLYTNKHKKLPHGITVKVAPQLAAFFNKNKAATVIGTTVQNEWAQLVSNLESVNYLQQSFEIAPSLSNVLQLINILLFGNSLLFNLLTLEERLNVFVEAISRPGFVVDWTVKGSDKQAILTAKDNNVTIQFVAQLTADKSLSFDWEIMPQHAVLSVISDTDNKDTELLRFAVGDLIKNLQNPSSAIAQKSASLLGWFKKEYYPKGRSYPSETNPLRLDNLPSKFLKNVLFSLDYTEDKLPSFEFLSQLPNEQVKPMLMALFKSLPVDEFVYRRLLRDLKKHQKNEIIDELYESNSTNQALKKLYLEDKLIAAAQQKNTTMVEKLLKSENNLTNRTLLLMQLINNYSPPLFPIIEKYIEKIKDTNELATILYSLRQNATEFSSLIEKVSQRIDNP